MKKKSALVLGLLTLVLPAIASAQSFTYVNNWLNQGIYWLRLSVTLIMIAMTLYFLWNVFQFIKGADKPEDVAKLRDKMINGGIGLFVAVGIWGIIKIVGGTLGVATDSNGTSADTPGVTCPPGLRYERSTGTCEK